MKAILLSEICKKESSDIAQKDLENREGRYPIYGAGGLIKNVDFYQQDKPYVAVVKDGAGVGRVMSLPAKSSVIGTMQYIIPNSGVDVNYLAYALESLNLSRYYTGATIPHIYFKDYCKEKLPCHDLNEQIQIAALLGKVHDLIVLRERQLAKLDELVKARFVEVFGDSKTNPKHWAEQSLDSFAEVGSSKRVFVEELQEEGIPFFRGTEIGALAEGKQVIPELFITPTHYRELCNASGAPTKGDLLLPSICPDGRIWLVDTDRPFYFKDGRVLWIHPTNDNVESIYLLYALKEKLIADYANIASGTTFAELKIFALKSAEVMIPPIGLQKQFTNFIQTVNVQRLTMQQGLDKLETLKKALMQKYFG